MPKRLAVLLLLVSACGSVVNHDMTDASPGDDQSDAAHDASTCGGAGQTCCASDSCATGLACTASDQLCRSAELFIVGTDGGTSGTATIAHGVGATFAVDQLGTGSPTAIFGTSSSDVWAIVQGPNDPSGAQTTFARHWNGSAWGAQINFPVGFIVYGLWGNAPNNYWAVNNAGGALHWNGTAWSAPQTVSTGVVLTDVWGSSDTDVWALGQTTVAHWDGSGTWTATTRSDFTVYARGAIAGRPSGDVLAGGLDSSATQRPAVLRRTGTQFTVEPLGDGSDCATTTAIWDGPDDAWALTAAQIQVGNCDAHPNVMHYTSGAWMNTGKLPNAASALAMWATSNHDLLVVGGNTSGASSLFEYDGTSWTAPYTAPAGTVLTAIWGTGQPQ